MISLICGIIKRNSNNQKARVIKKNQEQTGGCQRWGGRVEVGKMGEEGQEIQTSSYKINNS